MTFLEAKDELKRLAEGSYHSIRYELVEYASGAFENECYLYLDPRISVSARTWKTALDEMKIKLGLCKEIDLTEAPREEKEKEE